MSLDHWNKEGTARWADRGPLLVILVALLAFLVFSGTLRHELVWDDGPVIRYARTTVQEGGLAGLVLATFSTGVDGPDELTGYYRPVSLASMWINSPGSDPSPLPFHLVNILLHVINSLLFYYLLSLMIPSGPGALLGGLIFAVHPVHAESVAFVSGRTDLLAALFVLLVVVLWYRSDRAENTSTKSRFALAMVLFALGCLSKEIAFVLPAVILCWVALGRGQPGEEGRKGGWLWNRWIIGPSVVLGAVMFLRVAVLRIGTGPGWSRYAQLGDASLFNLLGDVTLNILHYLRIMVFPWPLYVFYPPVTPRLTWITVLSALLFLVMCLAFSGRQHDRIGIVAGVWTLVFLFPVSGIVGLGQSVIAERFCYLPSMGIVMVVGYSLAQLRPRSAFKHLHTFLVMALLVLFSAGSVLHSARWKDDLTLFTNALYEAPVKVPTMYVALGVAYKDRGEKDLALEAFGEAVRLDPSFLKGLLNLGVTQTELGYPEEALKTFDRARVLSPADPAVWYNRAVALEDLGRREEALKSYETTARLDPGESAAFYSKGKLLSQLGRHEESLAAYREAVAVDPEHVGAYLGMGRSYESMGQPDEAVEMFMKAIEIKPEEIISYGDLGRVLLGTGRAAQAVKVYSMAAAMDPGDSIIAEGLVVAWFRAGEEEKARAYVADLEAHDEKLHSRLSDLMVLLSGEETGAARDGQDGFGPAGALSLDKKSSDK